MDHHCPWIGNCIGHKNQKMFIIFSCWSLLCCVAMISLSATPLVNVFSGSTDINFSSKLGIRLWNTFIISFCIEFISAVAFLLLSFSQIYFMLQNITTIESSYSGKSPYNLGYWMNAKSVFGEFEILWILPIPPSRPICDGMTFVTKDNCALNEEV